MKIPFFVLLGIPLCACDAMPPTAPPAPARTTSATVAAAEAASPAPVPVLAPAPAPAAAPPSFDCAHAADAIEILVCGDAGLAELDRQLAASIQAILRKPGANRVALVGAHRAWLQRRTACSNAADARACAVDAYKSRIVRLMLDSGEVMAPKPTPFTCDDGGGRPFTATFYNDIQPKAAVLAWGDDQAIVFPLPAASGSRYGTQGVEFWEHQGEAMVDFRSHKMTCKPVAIQR